MRGRDERGAHEALDAKTSERLSARLREARLLRGMTLKVLADAAGCSESLLSKIENGKAYPSLPMLNRLVGALDMSMGWMFDDRDGKAPVIFRGGLRPPVQVGDRAIRIERVIPEADTRKLQCSILHVEAGGSSDGPHQHEGEEAGFLLDGQLELQVDGRTHRLNAGDAFAFRADQPHGYRNVGVTSARVFWVNTPPAI